MNEQRLTRTLSDGPPFATRYVAAPLALDEEPAAGRAGGNGRLLVVIAATALLLVAALVGTALIGTILSDDRTVPPDAVATPIATAMQTPIATAIQGEAPRPWTAAAGTRGYAPGRWWWDPSRGSLWMHNVSGETPGVDLTISRPASSPDGDEPGTTAAVVAGHPGTYLEITGGDRMEIWTVTFEGTTIVISVSGWPEGEGDEAKRADARGIVESMSLEAWDTPAGFRLLFTLPEGWDSG